MPNNLEQQTDFKLPVKKVTGETVEERLTENAYQRILPARYLLKDEKGEVIETVEEMFERVAKNVAQPDKKYDDIDYEESWKEFFDLMTHQAFMPNSPTLMNAGADLQQLSACFVAHPEDDMDSIFNCVHDAAKIFQSGGGMGYPFHLLRPKGDQVKSTGGIASGPMTFQQVFDTMCGTIKQGGKRRGAQMGIMRIDHPDVLRFIISKRKEGNLSNFNISVGLTEDFMEAVKNDEDYVLINPRTEEPHIVNQKTAEFYNSDEEWYPKATGSDSGKDDNFWRDFAPTFGDEIKEFEIDLQPGEEMKLPARFIWETLVDGAWRNGEPGLFMYDETNDMHSFDINEHPEHKVEATNPCVTGDTLIYTRTGVYTAEELYNQRISTDVIVDGRLSDERVKEASSVYKTGTKDVYKLKTEEGFELRLTEDHRVMTENGWKETKEIEQGEEVHILDREGCFGHAGTEKEGRILGRIVGEGILEHNEEQIILPSYEQDAEILRQFAPDASSVICGAQGSEIRETRVQQIQQDTDHTTQVRSSKLYGFASEYGLQEEKLQVPDKVFRSSKNMAKGFLQGLFTADSYVQEDSEEGVQVRISSSHKPLLKQTQQLLINFGIYSKICENSKDKRVRSLAGHKERLKDDEAKAQHELAISKDSLVIFKEEIGFLTEDKNRKLKQKLSDHKIQPQTEQKTAKVKQIEKDGYEDVYDLTEPDTHSFIANGIVVHNCGEQPLENYEACNLGHINLSLLVKDQGDGTALTFAEWKQKNKGRYDFDDQSDLEAAMQDYVQEAVDMEQLEYVAKTGTRFLDNVVTMSDFPLEEIEDTVSSLRKIGLGLMGYAQMNIQLGIRYGSEESVAAAKEIQRLITRFSIEESHRLAKERGKFSEWEKSKWAKPTEYSDWFEQYTGGLNPEEFEDGLELRNHNTVTIAPTGTTSMIADTSGGCEPIFSLAYFKNVAKDIQGEDMLVEFDDYFIRALEANDVDVEEVKQAAQNKMENNEWEGVNSIPDTVLPPHIKEIFTTANQVTAEEHVDIQAAFQYYNHSGISKTCNFPNSATKEDVREAYMRAYDKGIKGMTVYRDGTRDVQVLQTNQENTLTDMDKVDMLSEIVEEFGGATALLESNEFEEVVGETDLELQEQELEKKVTQDGVEADNQKTQNPFTNGGSKTSMSKEARKRPKVITGSTQEIETAYGDLYVTINDDQQGPFEVFAQIGKAGGYTQSFTEGLGRTISLALRTGADAEDVIKQLDDIRSPQISWDQGTQIHSVPDAIAEAIKRHIGLENGQQQTVDNYENQVKPKTDTEEFADSTKKGTASIVSGGNNPECPDCGGMLELQEGCKKCSTCGWSQC